MPRAYICGKVVLHPGIGISGKNRDGKALSTFIRYAGFQVSGLPFEC